MKIRALTGFAGIEYSAAKGQSIDCPDTVAKDLIAAGYAEEDGNESKRADGSDNTKSTKGKSRSAKSG